jgi:hypothetical protein
MNQRPANRSAAFTAKSRSVSRKKQTAGADPNEKPISTPWMEETKNKVEEKIQRDLPARNPERMLVRTVYKADATVKPNVNDSDGEQEAGKQGNSNSLQSTKVYSPLLHIYFAAIGKIRLLG